MHDIDTTRLEYEAPTDAFEFELAGRTSEFGGPLSEVEEMELAAELLTVSDEAELDQFLGSLFQKAAKGLSAIRPLSVRYASFSTTTSLVDSPDGTDQCSFQ